MRERSVASDLDNRRDRKSRSDGARDQHRLAEWSEQPLQPNDQSDRGTAGSEARNWVSSSARYAKPAATGSPGLARCSRTWSALHRSVLCCAGLEPGRSPSLRPDRPRAKQRQHCDANTGRFRGHIVRIYNASRSPHRRPQFRAYSYLNRSATPLESGEKKQLEAIRISNAESIFQATEQSPAAR
jgi:hypothetical protein